ncbi:MAG: cobalamin B12-binding domain-containing protein [Steroidobacteraceae bacterium]|jgi:methanogenic corrinoid protein MtbC1
MAYPTQGTISVRVKDAKMARLLRTIEGEIVPRLVLARRAAPAPAASGAASGKVPDAADVTELVRLLLAHDVGVASAYVETIRLRGASLEAVCLGLLAPAARELGLLWEADECDFMQVTVGLCRLHQLLRELSPEFRCESLQAKIERNILLSPVPGDQHTFGITLVAQFLRKAGWQVMSDFSGSTEELLEIVGTHWFAAVGFSVGSESRTDQLPHVIHAVRHASNNRSVGILVGGPLLVARPELASSLGADATALDGLAAVQRAEQILDCQRDRMQGY